MKEIIKFTLTPIRFAAFGFCSQALMASPIFVLNTMNIRIPIRRTDTTNIMIWVIEMGNFPSITVPSPNTEGKFLFSEPKKIINRFVIILDIPIVVMREAIGGDFFFLNGSNATLSIVIPKIPVNSIAAMIPGTIPNCIPIKTIAISAPKA